MKGVDMVHKPILKTWERFDGGPKAQKDKIETVVNKTKTLGFLRFDKSCKTYGSVGLLLHCEKCWLTKWSDNARYAGRPAEPSLLRQPVNWETTSTNNPDDAALDKDYVVFLHSL